ncbi:MAG: cyclic nucleotide-binding domain-containing protein [Spirochaetales bacterium]|nr:cyclic nucleotide-binding domain-containing protein [Spirochaetales bacterium]
MNKNKLLRFEEGDVLFRTGDNTREMYIIRSGTVKVMGYKNGEYFLITELGKGHYIGEMSFLTGIPRSATVVAGSPVLVNVVSADLLSQEDLGLSSWAVSIAKVLVRRIRKTTEMLGNYLLTTPPEPGGRRKEDNERVPFSVFYSPIWENRLYLKGFLTEDCIDEIKEKIRTLRMKEINPVILDFSDVIDVDNQGINYLYELIQSYNVKNNEIQIENIQLIRDKVISIKGIQDIVISTKTPIKRIEAGEYLIRQDSVENTMYVVKSGSFSVVRHVDGQELKLAGIEAGDVTGEMSLVKQGVRSASVIADKSSMVYVIDTKEFYKNTYNVPTWFMELIKGLVDRLRDTNEMLEERITEQIRQEEEKEWPTPFSIMVDSQNPGKMKLQGIMTIPNLQYFTQAAELEVRRGSRELTVNLGKVESADSQSISYLLYLYRKLKARNVILKFENTPRELMEMFRKRTVRWGDRPEETGSED